MLCFAYVKIFCRNQKNFPFGLGSRRILDLMIQIGRNISLLLFLKGQKDKERELCVSPSFSFRLLPGGQRSYCRLISETLKEASGNIGTNRQRQGPTRHIARGLDGSSPQRDVKSLRSRWITSPTLSDCL